MSHPIRQVKSTCLDANGLQIAIWPALTFALGNQLHLYLQWINVCVALSHKCALNVKAVVAAFNQEKYQLGAFSVIVKSTRTFVSSSTARTLLRGDTIAAVSVVTISRAIIFLCQAAGTGALSYQCWLG